MLITFKMVKATMQENKFVYYL